MSVPGMRATPVEALLAALDDRGREQVTAASTTLEVAEGESVVTLGDYVDHIYMVREGLLRAELLDRHGLPFEVARYGRGEIFGEMSFLRGDRASATVRAVTAVRLTAVPHAVLGEMAERYPGIMRELASLIAQRLSETNQRFRQLRPGRAVACVTTGSEGTVALLRQVALSASRHLRRPVLVLDMVGSLQPRSDSSRLPPLSQMLAEPGDLAMHDRFAERGEADFGVMDGSEPVELSPLLGALSDLQGRHPLVIVHMAGGPMDERVIDAIDGPLLFREAEEKAEWAPFVGRPGALEVVLRERNNGTSGRGRTVVADAATLAGPGPEWSKGREPWASVEWIARFLIRRRVGLALGAGGSKGYAHLGVIERLQELNIPFDYIAGTSIGSPIAAAVAAQIPLGELKDLLDHTFARALRPTVPIQSFLSSRALSTELQKIARGLRIEDLPTPLAIVTVDLLARTEVVLTRGDLAQAMVASMAIPGIFPPVRANGRQLVDGALLNPIPNATVAEMGADVVIGVKLTNPSITRVAPVSRRRISFRAPPIIDSIQAAFEVMQWKISESGAAGSDIPIEPQFVGTTGLRDFTRGAEFMTTGRAAVDAAGPSIAELLPWTHA
jgi:NTE family protein